MADTGFAAFFDYRVDILRRRNRVTATLNGTLLAESERTLLVDEQSHGLVFYFPEADIRRDLLEKVADLSTVCPWKGTASYWKMPESDLPIAWAYADPEPEVAAIRGHIAFYQDRVTISIGTAPLLAPDFGAGR